jgi:8-oxo-dGTP diphosphatase
VTGLLERAGRVLLVASRYPNQSVPLWNLPGGRQRSGELLEEALRREFAEETSLEASVEQLLYLSESYDRATGEHFLNATFAVSAGGEPRLTGNDAHVVDLAWVSPAELPAKLSVAVVREPLLATLRGESRRYFAFADAGITIEFADPS